VTDPYPVGGENSSQAIDLEILCGRTRGQDRHALAVRTVQSRPTYAATWVLRVSDPYQAEGVRYVSSQSRALGRRSCTHTIPMMVDGAEKGQLKGPIDILGPFTQHLGYDSANIYTRRKHLAERLRPPLVLVAVSKCLPRVMLASGQLAWPGSATRGHIRP